MNWHPPHGTFQPEELSALKRLFDEITSQPWFANDEATRMSFATYLFDTFPGSRYNPVKHRAVVEASARMFYGLDPQEAG